MSTRNYSESQPETATPRASDVIIEELHSRPESIDGVPTQPTIPLEPMAQQVGVRVQHDDWTGITDPAERRRLQNRLHQRLWRKRHGSKPGKETGAKLSRVKLITPEDQSEDGSGLTASGKQFVAINSVTGKAEYPNPSRALIAKAPATSLCNLDPMETQKMVVQFEKWYLSQMAGSPSTDNLLTLVQFNVFRALMNNTFALGFSTAWLYEDAVSPFNTMPLDGVQISYPASLRPTTLQHTVEHHPWIDLLPVPAMRDNLLSNDGAYDEDDLCRDLVEFCTVPGEVGGLLVWGEPSNPYNWEVHESFAKKWGWVIKGCHDLMISTNLWRAKRGEKRLLWDV